MKTIFKELYNKISDRHPIIDSMIHRIYYRKPFNRIKRMIRGKNNVITSHNYVILSSVIYDIKGNDNKIEIMDGCILNNVTFYIRGDGHRVINYSLKCSQI
ncbi:hypothetical protein GMMP15_70005 [Candidatus Magnetomoraceae bacterium gMMP-15]